MNPPIEQEIKEILDDLLNQHEILIFSFPNKETRIGMRNQIRDRAKSFISRCYVAKSELVSEDLFNTITDNGRLQPIHFETWAKTIKEQQGYDDSELICLLKRLAQAIHKRIKEGR